MKKMRFRYGVIVLMFLILSGIAYADVQPTISFSVQPSTTVELNIIISGTATDVIDPPSIRGVREIKIYEDNQVIYNKNCNDNVVCPYSKSITHLTAGNRTYYVTAKDKGNNMATTNSITVIFRGPNLPPFIQELPNQNVNEDSGPHQQLINLWDYTSDDRTAVSQLTYTVFWQENSNLTDCSINGNRYLNCTLPTLNAFGQTITTIQAFDGQLTYRRNVTIIVDSVNDAPWLSTPIPNVTFAEDSYDDSINLSNYFSDIEDLELGYKFGPSNNNISAYDVNQIMNITSVPDYFGTLTLLISAYDDEKNNTNTTIYVYVTPVNDAPYFNPDLVNQNAIRFLPFMYDINASDVDPGDVLTYTSNETLFAIDPNTGLINFTPMISGNRLVNITVCDDSAALNNCASSLFNLEIIYIPRPGFVNNTPLNATYSDPGYYELFITIVPSSTIDTVLFEFNGVNVTAALISGNTYKANLTDISPGNYTYRWHANYTNSLSNSSILYNLEIFQATPQLMIPFIPESPSEYGTVTNVSCYSNTSQLPLTSLALNGFPQFIVPDVRNNLPAGMNNYTCYSNGNQNYTATFLTRFYNITKRTINMTLNGPTGTLPSGTQTNFNCSIDFNQTTPALTRNFWNVPNPDIVTLGVGIYNYTCSVAGTANWYGVIKSQLINITPLTTNLTLNAPTTLTYGTPMNVNCSANINQSIVTLMRNGTIVSNPDTTSLSPGYYNYTCTTNGTSNYTDASETKFVNITIILTTLTLNVSSTLTYGSPLNVTCSVDNNQSVIQLMRDSVGISNHNISFLAAGYYNYTCTAIGTANYTDSSVTNFVNITKATPLINLTLNQTQGDVVMSPPGGILNVTGTITTPAGGNILLYINNTLQSSTSVLYNFTVNVPVKLVYPATQNYSYAETEYDVYVGTSLMLYNWSYPSGSHFNRTFFPLQFNANMNVSCRWSWNDTSYDTIDSFFTFVKVPVGYYWHIIILPDELGWNNVSITCVNETAATNRDFQYHMDNIVWNSTIVTGSNVYNSILRKGSIVDGGPIINLRANNTIVNHSTLNDVYATDSFINNSRLTNCTIINSTVKDKIGSNCYIVNSNVDPSDVTGSNITNSIILHSNATYSMVDDSTIEYSDANYSIIYNSLIQRSKVDDSFFIEAEIIDSIVYESMINESLVINSTIVNGSIIEDESIIINSTVSDSIIYNSSIANTQVSNANIINNVIHNGTIILFNGSTQNITTPTNLSELVNQPPVASFTPTSASTDTGTVIQFFSTSTDPNIGGVLNDSLTYLWTFGDGNTSNVSNPSYIYFGAGTYSVTLQVTDKYGLTNTAYSNNNYVISTPGVTPPPAPPGGSSGGGGGGGGASFARTHTYDLDSGVFFHRNIGPKDKILIKYKDTEHLFEISKLTRENISLLIDNVPSNLLNGGLQRYDLNNDHYYDMEVAFVKNHVIRAEFRIIPIQELVPGYNPFSAPSSTTIKPEPVAEPVVISEPEPELVEAPAETTKELETTSKFWSKFKNLGSSITGAVVGISDNQEVGGATGLMILLAVIIIGIFMYWIYNEWF